MNSRTSQYGTRSRRPRFLWIALALAATFSLPFARAQASPAAANPNSERAFPQSRAAIEKALKSLQAALSGRLPSLEGFAEPGDHPLDRYQRGFYQSTVQVTATASGGALVRVSTKVTAWYNDPAAAHSGYQLLTSNGRLEADLLDQLADRLAADRVSADQVAKASPAVGTETRSETSAKNVPAAAPKPSRESAATKPPTPESTAESTSQSNISAPSANSAAGRIASSLTPSLAEQERASAHMAATQPGIEKTDKALQTEADNLQEILKNQAHPTNLVAVKKSGTPVVSQPSLNAKAQFLASMHDEFEMLDFNADWVHIRISGLSRGWIWRDSVEMPDGIPDTATHAAQPAAADLYHVTREETAPFPGDWAPLRGKSVKIISVEKLDDTAKDAVDTQRLEYAKFLLDKNVTELSKKPQDLAGVVVIFDSADGGMIAATLATLQQWRAGTLTDSALWHKCFFDPPEAFDAGSPASQ